MNYKATCNVGYIFYKLFYRIYLGILSLFSYGQLENLRKNGHQIGTNVRLGRHAVIHVMPGGKLTLGANTCIEENAVMIIEKGGTLTVGEQCYLSRNLFLGCSKNIQIGDRVAIGGYVTIIDVNKCYEDVDRPIIKQGHTSIPVIIENDVWIGGNATLLAGTHLQQHTVVAAASVVRGTVDNNCVVAGIPARIVRRLGENN